MSGNLLRREALGRAAAAGAGLALAGLLKARSARGQTTDDKVVLNKLLIAEYQAIKAYSAGGA